MNTVLVINILYLLQPNKNTNFLVFLLWALHSGRSSSYNCSCENKSNYFNIYYFCHIDFGRSIFFPKKDKAYNTYNSQKVEQEETRGTPSSADTEDYGDFYLSIDKINVKATIIRGVDPTDKTKYNESLKDGVAHMIGTALPGEGKGNVFIYGHSSADKNDTKYNKIFSGLDELVFGDTIKVHYKEGDFEYRVREKKFVEKTDFSVLDQSGEERVTLMTCWPIGTDDRRLVVMAKK